MFVLPCEGTRITHFNDVLKQFEDATVEELAQARIERKRVLAVFSA